MLREFVDFANVFN